MKTINVREDGMRIPFPINENRMGLVLFASKYEGLHGQGIPVLVQHIIDGNANATAGNYVYGAFFADGHFEVKHATTVTELLTYYSGLQQRPRYICLHDGRVIKFEPNAVPHITEGHINESQYCEMLYCLSLGNRLTSYLLISEGGLS